MNCDEYRNRVQARLDGNAVEGDDARAHVALCPECRALEGAARRLEVGMRLLSSVPVPEEMSARIVAGVQADRRRRRLRRRLAVVGTLAAVAASLVLAFFTLTGKESPKELLQVTWESIEWRIYPERLHRRASQDLKQVTLAEHPAPDPEPPPSLNDNMAEATTAVESLVRRTADETVQSGRILVPSVSLPMPTEEAATASLEPPTESLRQTGHGVAAGLQPVAASAVRAFDLFRRDLPPMTRDANSGL